MKGFRAYFSVGLVLASGLAQLCKHAQAGVLELNPENPRITVHVFNSARISRDELIQAEREAATILAQAGVSVVWTDCPVLPGNNPADRPCSGFYDSSDMFLDIQPWSMVNRLGLEQTMLGACTATADGRRHTQALVSHGRVEFLAFQWDIDSGLVLGAAVAHEIGHLLLRQTTHSRVGIMRSDFSKEDFRNFNWRHLRFTNEQAQAMQAEVIARFSGSKRSQMQHASD
jgi:hypothetical protein